MRFMSANYDFQGNFNIVAMESNVSYNLIKVGFAKQIKKIHYRDIPKHIERIQEQIKPDMTSLEINNQYAERLLDLCRIKHNLDIKGLTISESNFEPQKEFDCIEQSTVLEWVFEKLESESMVLPSFGNISPSMKKLSNQINNMKRFYTLTQRSIHAPINRKNTNLFMALLSCCAIHMQSNYLYIPDTNKNLKTDNYGV